MADVPPNTIVALMGPTASGKTELALRLADVLPVDLISVDSAMIYRGMDIGTAKPDRDVLARHPHGLIDIRDPAERYSVGDFVADVRVCIEEALARGRLPLLVGGTMLYFNAFRTGLAALPTSSPEVREEFARRARTEGLAALHAELVRIDPIAAQRIHPNNPQRLLRALEVHATTGRAISDIWAEQRSDGVAAELGARLVEFVLEPSRSASSHAIERRFATMLERGFIDEVRALKARGDLSLELPSMRAVGYRQAWLHLDGEMDHETMMLRGVAATRQLAKRQRTWLRRWHDAIVLNDSVEANTASILQSLHTDRIVRRSR